jgi:serine/threonine-protein kinase
VVTLSAGTIFHDRYEVVRCIKAGGMGAVYEVIHLETRRRRALKLMLPAFADNVDMRVRFKLEATVAADVESEHIVETLDAGVDDETGAPFLVMELLRGSDLAAVLARRGRLSPADVVRLLSQAASALDKTHAAGVVHRDLKPENLFLTRRDDGSPKLKILDFGIAKIASESGQAAAKTKVLGTPIYMSPEQVRGDGSIGPRADLYALAQIAFTLLVGKAYWAEEHDALPTYALMTKIIGECPEPASARAARYGGATLVTMGGTPILPPVFDAWFARATRVVPEERFPSAAAMVEALAEALGVAVPRAEGLVTAPRLPSAPRSFAGPSAPRSFAGPSAPRSSAGLAGPADPVDGATLSLPSARRDPLDLDREPVPEAKPTRSSDGTRTEEPAFMASAERPRKGFDWKRVAGLAAATALVAAIVVGSSRPAATPATVSPTPSSPSLPAVPSVSARETLFGPPGVSASTAVAPDRPVQDGGDPHTPATGFARRAGHDGGDPHTAATRVPTAPRSAASVVAPRSSAPPAAPPPSPTGDAHPARSMD